MNKCNTCRMNLLCTELEKIDKVPKHENCACYNPVEPVGSFYLKITGATQEDEFGNVVEHYVPCKKDDRFGLRCLETDKFIIFS